jgi:hypothetical protein
MSMHRTAATTAIALALLGGAPATAQADYREARQHYEALSEKQRTAIALALIASGDFEGLAEHGFTRRLYRAIVAFERREGFRADGVLRGGERDRLTSLADRFYARLGNRFYTHPDTGARLLVPRGLFDEEKKTTEGIVFSRKDGMLSLIFLSFPAEEKGFAELWRTLSANGDDKRVTYKRRFDNHFVATGFFQGRKFYTWMARTGTSSTGFTVSWAAPWEETGRKVSTLLANAFLTEPR